LRSRNQFHAVFDMLDGYTVVKDPDTGCIAEERRSVVAYVHLSVLHAPTVARTSSYAGDLARWGSRPHPCQGQQPRRKPNRSLRESLSTACMLTVYPIALLGRGSRNAGVRCKGAQ
jgi:hypothetical protein